MTNESVPFTLFEMQINNFTLHAQSTSSLMVDIVLISALVFCQSSTMFSNGGL